MTYYINDFSSYFSKSTAKDFEKVDDMLKNSFKKKNYNNNTGSNKDYLYSSFSTSKSSLSNDFIKENDNPLTIIEKIEKMSKEINGGKIKRLDFRDKRTKKHVDVMDIRYNDINSNFYFLAHRQRFKNVYDYNKKAQDIYSNNFRGKSLERSDKCFNYRKNLDKKVKIK